MKCRLLVIDPYDPALGLLVPLIAQRILAFASERASEMTPRVVARHVMARLWQEDPMQKVGAFLTEDGRLVGHVVISAESDGVSSWLFVSQCVLDSGIDGGPVIEEALDAATQWGREYSEKVLVPRGLAPVSQILMATHRDGEPWKRKYGFQTIRRVMGKSL